MSIEEPREEDNRQVNTEGGAYIKGSVKTTSGDIVGRDQYKIIIQQPPSGITPFQAPPLTPHFVPRPEESNILKSRLLAEERSTPGILVVSAIQGLGGIGKSVLAAALAHDPEVRQRFPDGILWVTLGQQPDMLSLQSGWVQALGDYNFHPTQIEAFTTHLRTLLQDKAALLVIDDVWDPAHARAFLVGGSHCQVLITTRDALIAQAVGAERYDLDVMSQEQALMLLSNRLGREFAKEERKQALNLIETVKHLPLAIDLAAAQVADGLAWSELLAELQAEITRLEILDLSGAVEVTDEATVKRLSLRASFYLSLRRLPDEKRQNFAWLGVLPEDAILTAAMASTLWNTSPHFTQNILLYLRNKALLTSGVSSPDGSPTYRLHDLLHDLARYLLQAPVIPSEPNDLSGLGLELPAAHAALLERYQKHIRNELWHTLPNDGYIYANLSYHLSEAGQYDRQFDLVASSNHWAETRQRYEGSYGGYLVDLERAWRWAESEAGWDIGRQIRCALIESSIRSLAGNVRPQLLWQLVETGLWSPPVALAHLSQISSQYQRANALIEIFSLLPVNLLEDALAAALAITDEGARANALSGLAEHLPEELREEALAAAQAIMDEGARANALSGLAKHLPEERQ